MPSCRVWVFLVAVRLLVAGVTFFVRERLLAVPFFLLALGFLLQWLTGRNRFGTYWEETRILHAYLWAWAGVCMLVGGDLVSLAAGLFLLDIVVDLCASFAPGEYSACPEIEREPVSGSRPMAAPPHGIGFAEEKLITVP